MKHFVSPERQDMVTRNEIRENVVEQYIKLFTHSLTHSLTHGAELLLRSRKLCSHFRMIFHITIKLVRQYI
jgi:hypothetical protein